MVSSCILWPATYSFHLHYSQVKSTSSSQMHPKFSNISRKCNITCTFVSCAGTPSQKSRGRNARWEERGWKFNQNSLRGEGWTKCQDRHATKEYPSALVDSTCPRAAESRLYSGCAVCIDERAARNLLGHLAKNSPSFALLQFHADQDLEWEAYRFKIAWLSCSPSRFDATLHAQLWV